MDYLYGIHAVDGLLRSNPGSVRKLWLQAGRNDRRIGALEELAGAQGIPVLREARGALDERVSGRHQGVVAEVSGEHAAGANLWSEKELLRVLAERPGPALLLVLDGVTDPHNLGACLRCADAAGVDAVVVPRDRAADLTPVARKVACGAAETVPFVRVTNLSRTLKALKEAGLWLYGTDGSAEKSIYDNDLTSPLALVMGAEGKGLRRLTRDNCDVLVQLPMAGAVSSLNVSVATGVCLFEAVRQRLPGRQ
jgi:23S rRNA (guanosine2251-2'-O)-methyltransferase